MGFKFGYDPSLASSTDTIDLKVPSALSKAYLEPKDAVGLNALRAAIEAGGLQSRAIDASIVPYSYRFTNVCANMATVSRGDCATGCILLETH